MAPMTRYRTHMPKHTNLRFPPEWLPHYISEFFAMQTVHASGCGRVYAVVDISLEQSLKTTDRRIVDIQMQLISII